jgi:ABC-2 type transport system permease protein
MEGDAAVAPRERAAAAETLMPGASTGVASAGKWDARSSSFRHFVQVTRALTSTEFKLRYFGSVLGYLWTLLRPLMLFGVLYVVFTHVVRFGDGVPHYPVVLLAGIVVFNFFSEATSGGLGSLVARENLLRKVSFPRAAIPISVSMTSAANLGLGMIVVFGFAVVDGVAPSLSWFGFLACVAAAVALATATAVLLSVLYVQFRDAQPVWEVALQLLFWGTPIIYTIEAVPPNFQEILMFNPLAASLQQGRHWLSESSTMSAGEAIGGTALLLVPLAISVLVVVASVLLFRKKAPRIAEEL